MPTLSPYLAGWVGLLLFAAVMPGLWRGVFGALAALGWGSVGDPRPRALLADGLFSVILGLVVFGVYLVFFRVNPSLLLVLAAPALSVAGGAVCLAAAVRRWGERARRPPEPEADATPPEPARGDDPDDDPPPRSGEDLPSNRARRP